MKSLLNRILLLLAISAPSLAPPELHGQAGAFDPFVATRPAEVKASPNRSTSLSPALRPIGNVRINNEDINMAFQMISDVSGWSIFPGAKVQGKISLFAKDITAEELLDRVVTMGGFTYVRTGNVINVMTFDEYVLHYSVRKSIIRLAYRSADEVANALQPFLTTRGKLIADHGSSTIIIYDVPESLPQLEKIAREIDQPADARVVEALKLTYADAEELSEHLRQVYDDLNQKQIQTSPLRPERDVTAASSRPSSESAQLILSANTTVVIHAVPRTNHLLLRGTRADLAVIRELAESLDVPSDVETRTYPLRHLTAADIMDSIEKIVGTAFADSDRNGDGQRRSSSNQTGRLRGSTGNQADLTSRIGLSVVEENNSIALTAPPIIHRQVQEFLKLADTPPLEIAGGIRSYRLENANAADIARILQELVQQNPAQARGGEFQLGGKDVPITGPSQARPSNGAPIVESAGPTTPNTSLAAQGGDVVGVSQERMVQPPRVTFNEATNSVVIQGTIQQHDQFAQVIKELDRRLEQVLLEVTIVEIRGNDDIDVGVELESFQTPSESAGHLLFTSYGLSVVDPSTGLRTVSTLQGGTGALVRMDEVPVILHALQSSGKAKIRSAPRILVNDNSQGKILSIAEEPFSQVNASNTVATTSFGGFVQAGTQLVVTPRISNSDYLRLQYEITLNSFRGASRDASLPPSRDTTTISSQATVPESDTLIIGGLNNKVRRENKDRLPLVGDIPVLGLLFGRNTVDEQDTRIYVFVSPTILRDLEFKDLRAISEKDRHEADQPSGWPINPILDIEDEGSVAP